jgi:Mg2+-importing ATPase
MERGAAARLLLRQFRSPLVLILVVAAGLSLFLREWLDAAIILTIVLGSAALGFAQEYRASAALEALRRRLALTARVLRDGRELVVPAASVAAGDVALLAAGNLIPADGRILEARDFLVSEASLTGESFPVEKGAGDAAFMGTSVRSGTASVRVEKTGRATAYGAIAARLEAAEQDTEFARGVRAFGFLLLRVMLATVVFVLVMNQLLERPPIESLLFAVALAVGLTPELLPAIVTVTLARGAREMAGRGVIVRRLEALENLGSIDILCTDKTGTLTEGTVELSAAVDARGAASPEVLRLAWLNSSFETGIENPLDAALVAAGSRAGLSSEGCRKVDEIPYDFTRKRLTIVISEGITEVAQQHLIITKGAYASTLAACGGLDAAERARLEEYHRVKSAAGYRILALATKRVACAARYGREDERDMALAGFLLFVDPPKADARRAIEALGALGIQVQVITGDNRYVAGHLAEAIGLGGASMLTGEELRAMKDEALWQRAPRTGLFVEIDPQQKERIVRALQHAGHAVGFLGDGINDAPALHAADVGITVEGAVDVARESADVVLLARDLDVLRRGVEDGRRTFANTLKYISITTSANFGNMVSMAVATPLLPFLPLAAKQILLNNFLSDLPSMAISTDNVDADRVRGAQRWNVAEVRRFMIVFGLVSTAFDLVAFALLLRAFDADQRTFQTAWFVLSLLTELVVMLALRTHGPAWRSRPGALLLWSTLAVTGVALALPYLRPVASLFGFVPLPAALLAAVLLVAAGYLVATEAAKLWFFASRQRRQETRSTFAPLP